MALTYLKLRSIKAPYVGTLEIFDRDGLTVRLTKNAVITFNFRFQWISNAQRMSLDIIKRLD